MDYEWEFVQAKPQGWIWRRIDRSTGSVAQMSARTFALLYDCVEDAKQHGFVPSPARHSDEGPASARLTLSSPSAPILRVP